MEHDLEKTYEVPASPAEEKEPQAGYVHEITPEDEIDPTVHQIYSTTWLSRTLHKFGVDVEDRGIERVPPELRTHKHAIDLLIMWGSTNMAVSTFSIGVLAVPIFGLGFTDAVLTILFFEIFSNIFVSYFSTFGPKSGLRQMTVSRYSFGWYGNKVMAAFNVLSCLGWSAVNVTVGGQTLRYLASDKIPTPAGIVIIAFFTWFVSMVGYKWVHIYERYQWIPLLVGWLVLIGEGAKHFTATPMPSGTAEAGNVLTFGCVIVGGGLGWAPFAADYAVNLPEETPSWKVFIYTFLGLTVPTVLIDILGIAAGSSFAAMPVWAAAYDDDSMGGVLGAILSPLHGFGTFIMVIFTLSIIGGNLPNSYSLALSFQSIHPWFLKVPRSIWTTAGSVIYVALAIAASYDFASSLSSFMSLLSYFLAVYTTVLVEEHLIFRKGSFANYDLEGWNDKHRLPWGIAGMVAFAFGIMAAVLGMAQTWYKGVIGRQIGDPAYGGDIAFELAIAFSGIVYPIGRVLEAKWLGRY